jgi:mannitol-specific phosphotransferase system IIBC component
MGILLFIIACLVSFLIGYLSLSFSSYHRAWEISIEERQHELNKRAYALQERKREFEIKEHEDKQKAQRISFARDVLRDTKKIELPPDETSDLKDFH